MKYFGFLLLSCFLFQTAKAQLTQIIHQTFDVDEVTDVSLNLIGETKIEKWAGNTIMTETTIQLFDATPSVLKFFIEEGRYQIEAKKSDVSINLNSKDTERRTIKTNNGECYEFVKIRIFVPDDFQETSKNNLVRTKSDDSDG